MSNLTWAEGEDGEFINPIDPDYELEKKICEDGVIPFLINLRDQLKASSDNMTYNMIPYCMDVPGGCQTKTNFTGTRDKILAAAVELNTLLPKDERWVE